MHVLLGIIALAVLVGFAFGELAARVFVGLAISALASFVLLIAYVVITDQPRARHPDVVRVETAPSIWEGRR